MAATVLSLELASQQSLLRAAGVAVTEVRLVFLVVQVAAVQVLVAPTMRAVLEQQVKVVLVLPGVV
jgi:hypothetical protein